MTPPDSVLMLDAVHRCRREIVAMLVEADATTDLTRAASMCLRVAMSLVAMTGAAASLPIGALMEVVADELPTLYAAIESDHARRPEAQA